MDSPEPDDQRVESTKSDSLGFMSGAGCMSGFIAGGAVWLIALSISVALGLELFLLSPIAAQRYWVPFGMIFGSLGGYLGHPRGRNPSIFWGGVFGALAPLLLFLLAVYFEYLSQLR